MSLEVRKQPFRVLIYDLKLTAMLFTLCCKLKTLSNNSRSLNINSEPGVSVVGEKNEKGKKKRKL